MNSNTKPWMQRTVMLFDETQMQTLTNAHIMIFGLGGVGSYAAEALGRMGIGKLTLVDGDRFEQTNRNRQLCALSSTVNCSKVSVTAQRLLDINPDVQVVPVEGFYLPQTPVPIENDTDFVIDAIDTVSAKLHIIETCNAQHIPVISCMGMGNRKDPTQIKIGDIFNTSYCALSRVMRKQLRKRGINQLRCVYSTEEALICTNHPSPQNGKKQIPGSVSYVPSVAGLYMAYEAVTALCK